MGIACRLEARSHHVRELQVFSWRKFGVKILHEKIAKAEILQRFHYDSLGEMKSPLYSHVPLSQDPILLKAFKFF